MLLLRGRLPILTPTPTNRRHDDQGVREPPRPRTMRQRTTRLMTLFSEAKQTNQSAIRPAEPSSTRHTIHPLAMHAFATAPPPSFASLTLYTPSPSAWPIRVRTRSFDRPPSYGLRGARLHELGAGPSLLAGVPPPNRPAWLDEFMALAALGRCHVPFCVHCDRDRCFVYVVQRGE